MFGRTNMRTLPNGFRLATVSLHFHTSTASLTQASKRVAVRNKKKNVARTADRLKQEEASRPSVVLGTRTSDAAEKWGNCKLSKVIVHEELFSTTEMYPEQFSVGELEMPKAFGYGVLDAEKKLLFQDLPHATIHMTSQVRHRSISEDAIAEDSKREIRKANLLAKALDLRNANAAGIAYENRRRIIEAFSTPDNPFSPGRTEVQLALLTYKVRNLWKHLTNFKRDVGNRRNLRILVHQRASLLRYLKGYDRGRYDIILEQLSLDPKSVEGELVI